ncbi:hypothetical protein EV401DRAFT_2014225 [Pisolithus croceorrhizus]|nr:hypothetical protein EV401DRAFT_2014225 [Pisolithus croceorrhizus]
MRPRHPVNSVFTKCKESLQDGRRLENISWRLWHREFAQAQAQAQARGQQRRSSSASATCPTAYQPLTPVSMTPNQPENSGRSSPAPSESAGSALIPGGGITLSTTDVVLSSRQSHAVPRAVAPGVHVSILGLPSPGADGSRHQVATTPNTFTSARPLVVNTATMATATTRMEMGSTSAILVRSIKSHCVGRVIVEMLPNHLHIPKPRQSSSTPYPEPPPSPALAHTSRTSYEQSTTPTPISVPHISAPPQPTSHATPISLTCTSPNPSIPRPASSNVRAQATALSDAPPHQVPVVKLQLPLPSTIIDDEAGTNTASGDVTVNTYPRVIVVNPTPHPTPPTTPTLGGRVTPINVSFGSTTDNEVGRMQASKPTHLLPPLPLVAAVLSRNRPMRPQDNDQVSEPSRPLVPGSEQSAAVPTLVEALAQSADLSDGVNAGIGVPNTPSESRRFFLQHSPDDISPEEGDGHDRRCQQGNNWDASFPTNGGELADGGRCDNPSSRDTLGARRSRPAVHSQGTTTKTSAKGKGYRSGVAGHGGSGSEYDNDGGEDERDKRSVSAATNNSSGRGRKGRMGATACRTHVGRLKRAHSAKHGVGLQIHYHVVPMMQERSTGQVGERRMPQHYSQQQQHKASFNIGSGSSGGSKSTQSTNAPMYVPAAYGLANGAAKAQVQVPLKDSMPDFPIQLPSTLAAEPTTKVANAQNGSPPQNITNTSRGDGNASTTRSTNAINNQSNGLLQQQGRRTIVVATSEEEYETTDGSDSEWASEDMEEGEKNARSKDAGKPKQPQQQHHGGPDEAGCHGKSAGIVSKAAEEETRLREAALEAQRQRELFTKVPRRSYSNLNRTQSGLLSQLLNPNAGLFSPGHLDRTTRSSQDIVTVNLTMTQPGVQAQGQKQHHVNQPLQRSHNAFAAPPTRLSTSKSAVALPMAARVTAIGGSKPAAPAVRRLVTDENLGRNEKSGGGYRPKGRPQEEDMEDDSGEENEDDQIQVSKSVAQEKLQALMLRRSSSSQQRQQQRESEDGSIGRAKVHGKDHLVGTVTYTPGSPATMTNAVTMAAPTPIPLGHPYNLPPPAPPMTPRTTRRRMLRTELSESMRRQLLWERQVSSTTNPAAAARRARLTMTTSEFPMHADVQADPNATRGNVNGTDDREGRRRMLSRNWTWSDDYHLAGW